MRLLYALIFIMIAGPACAGTLQEANAAVDRGDYATALSILRPMATAGDVNALGNLGNMYANGYGVKRDLTAAHRYWSSAADKHLGSAMFNIAALYATGQGGLPKDASKAATWFKRAAEHRHLSAMLNLSTIYATGRGLPVDRRRAIAWASLAESNARTKEFRQLAHGQLLQLVKGLSREQLNAIQPLVVELARGIDANVALYRAQLSP